LIRGDHTANEIKIKKVLGVLDLELADSKTVMETTGAPVGFAGPINLQRVRVVADYAVKALSNFVVGGNEVDTHYLDANWSRDFAVEKFADLRNAQAGDAAPRGTGVLKVAKGIEVGHVFMLGTKYSRSMNATFLDPQGHEEFIVMGCYGIGIGRTAASSIEQNHDAKGIIWPVPIAPFHVHLLTLSQSAQVVQAAQSLYDSLTHAGIEVLWDDRDERAGVKFNDADLIGAPYHLVVGEKGLAQGTIELKERKTGESKRIAPDGVLAAISALIGEHA